MICQKECITLRKVKPQNTYRHLLNFVSKTASRPILKGFHITHDGHVEATNSHIMLRLLNRMPSNQECTFEPKELKVIENVYPNLDRIIPTNHNAHWKLDVTETPMMVKYLKGFSKNEPVNVVAKNEQLVITDITNSTQGSFALSEQEGEEIMFRCNATYLLYMMSFIADCSPLPVDIRVISEFRPVLFEAADQFVGLITPIRHN